MPPPSGAPPTPESDVEKLARSARVLAWLALLLTLMPFFVHTTLPYFPLRPLGPIMLILAPFVAIAAIRKVWRVRARFVGGSPAGLGGTLALAWISLIGSIAQILFVALVVWTLSHSDWTF
jgi:hypothetical protein